MGENSPVDNAEIAPTEVRVCSPVGGGLEIELPEPQDVRVWDSAGRLMVYRPAAVGTLRLPLQAGIYLLQCGGEPVRKVVVRD